jgi:hypothetical protein
MSSEELPPEYNNAAQHPYMQYIAMLNMTQCYKQMLLAGNPQIEQFIQDPEHYAMLKKDFYDKYPLLEAEFKKIQPSDCVIL